MDIFLSIIWIILCVLAIIGSIVPVLPGPLLVYIAFILLQLTSAHPFSWVFFIVWAIIVACIAVLEYTIPARGTKKFGGSKRWARGSTIGLVIAVIILPVFGIILGPFGLFGLIGGPFLWAYLGERYAGKQHIHALRSARGSFIWFIAGNLVKIVICCIMAGYFFINVYKLFIK